MMPEIGARINRASRQAMAHPSIDQTAIRPGTGPANAIAGSPEEQLRRATASECDRSHRADPDEQNNFDRHELTDVGNARRLVERFGHNLRYCHPWRKWLTWDGRRWSIDSEAAVERMAKATIDGLLDQAKQRLDWIRKQLEAGGGDQVQLQTARQHVNALIGHALKSQSARGILGMVRLARSEPGISVQPDQLDTDPWLLNVQNGTLDLRTGQIREHRREDLITKLAPVIYDPHATAPQFQRFLEEIFARDLQLVGYVRRLLGYCLTGDVSEQALFVFWGSGANGKSTLLELVRSMLDTDYAAKAAPGLLMARSSEAHPVERATLAGKRLVLCIETEENRRLAESLVKDLTGRDKLEARRLYENPWEFDPTHKIVLATNHKPAIVGDDHAIWRRLKLIPFAVTISDEKKDPHLLEKLQYELPGVLAWCVAGCLEWQKDGLGMPKAVAEATKEYRSEEDVLGNFLADCCCISREARARAADLYDAYRGWCQRNGETPVVQRRFGISLSERGFKRHRGTAGTHHWLGIGVTGVTEET